MLDLSYPALNLGDVEVCISGEVLTDRGVGITQSTVKGGATHADHYSNQTKQEEKQAGVPTVNILVIAVIRNFEADASLGGGFVRSGL